MRSAVEGIAKYFGVLGAFFGGGGGFRAWCLPEKNQGEAVCKHRGKLESYRNCQEASGLEHRVSSDEVSSLGVVAHSCNLNTLGGRGGCIA